MRHTLVTWLVVVVAAVSLVAAVVFSLLANAVPA
jgi:hypothetical protein